MGIQRTNGFTLLEVLVVMLLASMIALLMMEALSYVYTIQQRVAASTERMQTKAMVRDWLRGVLKGIQPDYPHGGHLFQGSADTLSGLTTTPLVPGQYGLSPFALALEHDDLNDQTQVFYVASNQKIELMRVPGGDAHFAYQDREGTVHANWPPPLGLWPQTPALIRLESSEMTLMVTPEGPHQPPLKQNAFFGGSP